MRSEAIQPEDTEGVTCEKKKEMERESKKEEI